MTESILVLAAVLGRFKVMREGNRPVLPVGIVTTQPDHPAMVRLTRR
jgi:unspecific monooxygenase